jgi:hypothetical protein
MQDCGPPVVRSGDPPPGWHWRTAADAKNRRDFGCPICLPEDARIATPTGDVRVRDVRAGMPVFTLDGRGNRIQGTVERVGWAIAPPSHQLVQIELSDGRTLRISPGHPATDGRPLGSLRVGEPLDGATVLRSTLVPHGQARTYDILPSGETGAYWANGVAVGSTLGPKR